MFRTIFTTLRALLKSGLCGLQLCIRSDTASYVLVKTFFFTAIQFLGNFIFRIIFFVFIVEQFCPASGKMCQGRDLFKMPQKERRVSSDTTCLPRGKWFCLESFWIVFFICWMTTILFCKQSSYKRASSDKFQVVFLGEAKHSYYNLLWVRLCFQGINFILHLVDKKFFPLQCRQRTQSRLECTFAVEDLETSGFAVRSHTQPPEIDFSVSIFVEHLLFVWDIKAFSRFARAG